MGIGIGIELVTLRAATSNWAPIGMGLVTLRGSASYWAPVGTGMGLDSVKGGDQLLGTHGDRHRDKHKDRLGDFEGGGQLLGTRRDRHRDRLLSVATVDKF